MPDIVIRLVRWRLTPPDGYTSVPLSGLGFMVNSHRLLKKNLIVRLIG
ncbi:uncharacterized protein METZ01_LOCUS46374 [marine metagenome]|uniref:Uncharacterized protein n=1 Tax=marine metagenome TaxID=408172 RepID=A0A381RNT0_9ZZZZ